MLTKDEDYTWSRSALLGWKLRKLVLTAGYALEPSRSGRRSIWASAICLTASKPIAPNRIASIIRSTRMNSRLPRRAGFRLVLHGGCYIVIAQLLSTVTGSRWAKCLITCSESFRLTTIYRIYC